MKLAVIADGHLFQTFMKNYDPLQDIKTVLEEIKRERRPDALLMAGDMFDCKKTPGVYLRHYEGEGLAILVRQIFRDFGLPVFSVRGNHEKEEVLKGLNQTVENFRYVKNDWLTLSDVSIYFMDSHFEGDFYEPEVVSQIIEQIAAPSIATEKTKLLLCHETFAPLPNCLPSKTIGDSKKIFDWILNGHMHFWSDSAYGLPNVVTLPAVLPSRVIWGKYWVEQYNWQHADKEPELKKRDSPYGYAILDTDEDSIELSPFTPSKKVVEVSIDTTNLNLTEAIKRFRSVLERIIERKDRDSLIILPEVHGEANFVVTFIKGILLEYSDLNLEDLRINTIPKIVTASGKVVAPPLLTPEQVFEGIETEFSEIREKLLTDLEVDVHAKTLKKILAEIRDHELLEKMPPRTTTRLENLLEVIVSQLEDVKKPATYEDDIKSIIKRVKE